MNDFNRDRLSRETDRAIAESRKCCAAYRAAKGRMDDTVRRAWERLQQAYRIEQAHADLGRIGQPAGIRGAPALPYPPRSAGS